MRPSDAPSTLRQFSCEIIRPYQTCNSAWNGRLTDHHRATLFSPWRCHSAGLKNYRARLRLEGELASPSARNPKELEPFCQADAYLLASHYQRRTLRAISNGLRRIVNTVDVLLASASNPRVDIFAFDFRLGSWHDSMDQPSLEPPGNSSLTTDSAPECASGIGGGTL